jgi:hypothetical protein
MTMFEWILVLLLAAVVLTNLAELLAVPYPSLLAIAGAGLAFLPFAPRIAIEPDLALALFVAPALLDAAAAARKVAEDHREPQAATKYDELRLRAIGAQREALHRLRAQGEIGDRAFYRIQEELDWSELDAAPAGSFQSLVS